ncbi:MAG TPA: acyltransferase, partial [Verrucomicrobiae bacterium]|nr:acyltransferase [Verrucomicrobiae bacterium]
MEIPVIGQRRPLNFGESLRTNAKEPALNPPSDAANLDFLRAVAVMLVFFVHLYDISGGHSGKWGIAWNLGRLGILLFFVHTALVLMWSLERSGLEGWRLPIAFYIRRIFRLYPLSIVCVLLGCRFDLSWKDSNIWPNLTLTQNLFSPGRYEVPPLFTPLWTLPLEVQMYVILPLLFVMCRSRPPKLLLAGWSLAVVGALIQPKLGDRFEIMKYLPCFLGGVIAWRRMRNGETRQLAGWLWPIAIAIVSILSMATNKTFDPLHIAVFGLCLGFCLPYFKEIPWPRIRAASKIVARYSYSIYLSHFLIQVFIFNDAVHHPMFKNIRQLPLL